MIIIKKTRRRKMNRMKMSRVDFSRPETKVLAFTVIARKTKFFVAIQPIINIFSLGTFGGKSTTKPPNATS